MNKIIFFLVLSLLNASLALSQEQKTTYKVDNVVSSSVLHLVPVEIKKTEDVIGLSVKMAGVSPINNLDETEAKEILSVLLKGCFVQFSPTDGEIKEDFDGRKIVYIYRRSDGVLVNEMIIGLGIGKVPSENLYYEEYRFKKYENFKKAESFAISNNIGFWKTLAEDTRAANDKILAKKEKLEKEKTEKAKIVAQKAKIAAEVAAQKALVAAENKSKITEPYYYPTGATRTTSIGGNSSGSVSSSGRVHVRGYFRQNGTYVKPYTRSSPKRRK